MHMFERRKNKSKKKLRPLKLGPDRADTVETARRAQIWCKTVGFVGADGFKFQLPKNQT